MAKQYYSLVAGLAELSLEADHRGFDAMALREEIAAELSERDREAFRTLYAFYDMENLIALLGGKPARNALGNYTVEQIAEALDAAASDRETDLPLPEWLREPIAAYKNQDDTASDTNGAPLENILWEAFYRRVSDSKNPFLRGWFAFDQTLRNISAAYIARGNKWPVGEQLVGENDITHALAQSSAADFGLRGEVDYVDSIVAMLEMKNMLEKEQRLDQIRWARAEELTTFDYFNVNVLLAYLVKANIIHRWSVLDRARGEQMLRRLLSELSDKSIVGRAEAQQ